MLRGGAFDAAFARVRLRFASSSFLAAESLSRQRTSGRSACSWIRNCTHPACCNQGDTAHGVRNHSIAVVKKDELVPCRVFGQHGPDHHRALETLDCTFVAPASAASACRARSCVPTAFPQQSGSALRARSQRLQLRRAEPRRCGARWSRHYGVQCSASLLQSGSHIAHHMSN